MCSTAAYRAGTCIFSNHVRALIPGFLGNCRPPRRSLRMGSSREEVEDRSLALLDSFLWEFVDFSSLWLLQVEKLGPSYPGIGMEDSG